MLRFRFALVAAFTTVALSGCSNMVTTAVTDPAPVQTAMMHGSVHGGQQPITNSTVTLWAAGNTGYGSAATMLAQTTSDSNGYFSFGPGSGHTYTCPVSNSATASQSIYITAVGGQPAPGVTNNQAALMVALGDCLTVQTNNPIANINELTTVVSMTALQQFFAPSSGGEGNFGTSATNTLGLANAMKTIANFVNVTYGTSFASTTISAAVNGYTTAPTVIVTPEQTKLDTIADILASCINTNGTASTACTTLFGNAGGSATDTLQAAYYMASNPSGTGTATTCSTVTTAPSICNLFGLVTSSSPFQPTLAAAPTDFTLGVTFSSSSSQTVSGGTVGFLNHPQYIALDSLGNVWVVNNSTGAAGAVGNSVSELSTAGAPEAQVLTAPGQLAAPMNIVVDPSNNLYVGNYGPGGLGTTVVEFNASLLSAQTYTLSSIGPEALASDGTGNIYIADAGTAGSGDLEVIAHGNNNSTGTATQISTGVSVGANSSLAIDSYNDLWLSNAAGSATTQFICTARPCTATSTAAGSQSGSQSVVVDHSNNIWIGNSSGSEAGSVSEIAATTTANFTAATGSPFSGGGLTNPMRSVFGGGGDQWITNYASGGGSLTELSPLGVPVSPSAGFTHTFAGADSIAIDASGNVWVGNSGTVAAAPNGFLTEIIGAAGPTITPYSANLPAIAGGAILSATSPNKA